MKNKPTLSISSYYGGKGRMAHFIADRLNYDCELFVTPFGGMCRELLNKPRHRMEIYNDYSSGLCALMTVLSAPRKADEFIHRVYEETEFSEECFLKYKALYDGYEKDAEEQAKERLRQWLIDKKIVEPVASRRLLDEILWTAYEDVVFVIKEEHKTTPRVTAAIEKLKDAVQSDTAFQEKFQDLLADWISLRKQKDDWGYLPRPADMMEDVPGTYEMDLAIATYVTFKMSRDGMGTTFSKEKFKTTDQYHAQVLKLYECAERLEGVNVFQIDAMEFFRRWTFLDKNATFDEIPASHRIVNRWINNPRVMMYCDPSYISVASEKKLLEGIDIDNEPCLSDAIMKKYDGKRWPANLGKVYARSFGYDDQEKFLQCIQKAKCSIMVSNYDLELYNKYLNESTGWRREEFITSTSVGGKLDNSRIEVIWYNY